jgi:uncharacterized protein (TIGR02265 family)
VELIPPFRGYPEAVSERSIKGSVLRARLAFIEQRLGKIGIARIVTRLRKEDREILEGILLPAGWYPFETSERLTIAIAEELSATTKIAGDDVYRELGRTSADLNLSASQRVYVRERDPHGLLKAAASIYRLYYSSGERVYERLGDKKAVLRTTGSETFSREDCLTIVGWHERAIAMCGGKNPRVKEPHCRAKGEEFCEYVCEWE